MNIIQFLPALIILIIIALEAFLNIHNSTEGYKVKDTLANVTIAVVNWITNFFLRGFSFLALCLVQQYSLFEINTAVLACVIAFLLADLCHYGYHYLEHKSRFFWATHSIHHSSASFNFSTAIRTAHTNSLYRLIYEAPLCFIGFDASLILLIHSIILLSAFLQHTELIGKLGWLEYILNTPSHHRVHHACNEKYLDKNFGGILIIWDKLFGTFQPEEEKPVYGLTKPINTYNPVKIVFHEWIAMTRDILKAKSWKQAFSYAFLKPGWAPVKNAQLADSANTIYKARLLAETINLNNKISCNKLHNSMKISYLPCLIKSIRSGFFLIVFLSPFLISCRKSFDDSGLTKIKVIDLVTGNPVEGVRIKATKCLNYSLISNRCEGGVLSHPDQITDIREKLLCLINIQFRLLKQISGHMIMIFGIFLFRLPDILLVHKAIQMKKQSSWLQ